MVQKTLDGLKLSKVIKALKKLAGVSVRHGKSHPYVAMMNRYSMPCPVASSTDARKMIVPWIKQAAGYKDSGKIYRALRSGGWN